MLHQPGRINLAAHRVKPRLLEKARVEKTEALHSLATALVNKDTTNAVNSLYQLHHGLCMEANAFGQDNLGPLGIYRARYNDIKKLELPGTILQSLAQSNHFLPHLLDAFERIIAGQPVKKMTMFSQLSRSALDCSLSSAYLLSLLKMHYPPPPKAGQSTLGPSDEILDACLFALAQCRTKLEEAVEHYLNELFGHPMNGNIKPLEFHLQKAAKEAAKQCQTFDLPVDKKHLSYFLHETVLTLPAQHPLRRDILSVTAVTARMVSLEHRQGRPGWISIELHNAVCKLRDKN